MWTIRRNRTGYNSPSEKSKLRKEHARDDSNRSDDVSSSDDGTEGRDGVTGLERTGISSGSAIERTRFRNTVSGYNTQNHREKWKNAYSKYLKEMYVIFLNHLNSVKDMTFGTISFDTFCDLIYLNSTGTILRRDLI